MSIPTPKVSLANGTAQRGLELIRRLITRQKSVLGSLGGPVGTAFFGAAGGALGESLAELYEGTDQNPTQIALSAALNAIPTAKYLAKGGTAALRAINPVLERRLAGMLAPEAASVGAGLLDRINPRELAKTVVKSATTGAVAAPIENSASRYVQGQPTTRQDVTQDMTLGALLGGTTPLAVKAAQVPFRAVARTVDSGLPAWLRKSENIDTAALQQGRAGQRGKGQPQTRQTNQTAAALGITGNISNQQDQVLKQVTQANTNIRDAVSQPNIKNINLSNSPDLVRRLNKMAEHFDNQDLGQKDADTARRLSQAIDGRVQISPEDALDLKQFLDKNRSSGSYTIDPQNATAAKGLKDLSDSIRADLKSQLPGVAKALDFAHEGYDLLGDLYKKGAINANVSLESDLGMKLARFVFRPSVRAKTANFINKLAGNVYESVPDVASLPQRPQTRGLLGAGAIPLGSIPDPSGVVPNYEPFVSRVQPRLTAGDPDAIPQSPPRTGGANQPGGFGGLKLPGGVMTPEQVPFTGSVPVGGRPSRGEPRVRMFSPTPRIVNGVVVDESGNVIGANRTGYIDAESVPVVLKQLQRGAIPLGSSTGSDEVFPLRRSPSNPKAKTKSAAKKLEEAKKRTRKKGA